MALDPSGEKLYFHAFSSIRESWVSTSILKNESLFPNGYNTVQQQFFTSDEARTSQSLVEVFDKNGK